MCYYCIPRSLFVFLRYNNCFYRTSDHLTLTFLPHGFELQDVRFIEGLSQYDFSWLVEMEVQTQNLRFNIMLISVHKSKIHCCKSFVILQIIKFLLYLLFYFTVLFQIQA